MAVLLLQYSHIVRHRDKEGELVQGSGVTVVLCARDPDRWTTVADEGAKALCRACPRRWECAQEACETPGAEGIWAGVLIPAAGRGRRFALKQLRSLAERNGFPVRKAG
jgi:WhiB family transcriptional regulator, redox-sensing transcriptional regulator